MDRELLIWRQSLELYCILFLHLPRQLVGIDLLIPVESIVRMLVVIMGIVFLKHLRVAAGLSILLVSSDILYSKFSPHPLLSHIMEPLLSFKFLPILDSLMKLPFDLLFLLLQFKLSHIHAVLVDLGSLLLLQLLNASFPHLVISVPLHFLLHVFFLHSDLVLFQLLKFSGQTDLGLLEICGLVLQLAPCGRVPIFNGQVLIMFLLQYGVPKGQLSAQLGFGL